MANHKSSKKSIRKTERRTLVNRMAVSKLRTTIKKLIEFIEKGDKKSALDFFPQAQSEIMKNVTKGSLKKNTASRRISRLVAQIKKIA
jgi:small subunit ribosomal protein S20